MPDESTGFGQDGPELDPGLPPAVEPEPDDEIGWPPWLENLKDHERIDAIVAALLACYGDRVGGHGAAGARHCSASMARVFLRKLLVPASPSLAEASEATLPSPEPPLPAGEYARVEIMGHDSHTGWVTDGTRGGAPVMVIRDWDGAVIAEVPGTSLYRFVPLATPLRRPGPWEDGGHRALGAADDDDTPWYDREATF